MNRSDKSQYKSRKSIFAREMDRVNPRPSRCGFSPAPTASSDVKWDGGKFNIQVMNVWPALQYLQQRGPQTVTGYGLGCRSQEAHRIHEENIERLCALTKDEIMAEREEILSSASLFSV